MEQLRVLPTEVYFAGVRGMLAAQGQAYVRVTGNSMWPLLRHLRDGVVIVPPERIRTGDVVLYDRKNGRYALHRVVWRGRRGFTMAGDNQWRVDYNLPYDQIVGVVSAIHRKGRYLSAKKFFLKMYAVAVTLLCVPRICLCKPLSGLRSRLRRGADERNV